jgi:hypothetical protein
MKHFTIQEWADFERQSLSADQMTSMQGHLETGCKNCLNYLMMWQKVGKIAKNEASCEPPAYLVRNAKGAFELLRPAPGAGWATNLAQMVFDSFRQPRPVGVRSSHAAARQLVYRAGSTTVDIRVEPETGRSRLSLVGQVLDAERPDGSVKALPVILRIGKDDETTTTTNEFGEFHFEVEAAERPLVGIRVGDLCNILVPVQEPNRASAESSDTATGA